MKEARLSYHIESYVEKLKEQNMEQVTYDEISFVLMLWAIWAKKLEREAYGELDTERGGLDAE